MLPSFGLVASKLHPVSTDVGVARPETLQKLQRWDAVREACRLHHLQQLSLRERLGNLVVPALRSHHKEGPYQVVLIGILALELGGGGDDCHDVVLYCCPN